MSGSPLDILDKIRIPLPAEFHISTRYYSDEKEAPAQIVMKRVLGEKANLLVVVAEEDTTITINNSGNPIPLKRDEAIVMINVLEVESLEVVEGKVKVFASTVPKWMPALFWTRSVTVLGVADAVEGALASYGAARDSSLQSILSQLDVALSTRASEETLQKMLDRLGLALVSIHEPMYKFTGAWGGYSDKYHVSGYLRYTADPGATMEFEFNGDRVGFIGDGSTSGAVINVYIDGVLVESNKTIEAHTEKLYMWKTTFGSHTFKIELVSGRINIYAIVLPKATTPEITYDFYIRDVISTIRDHGITPHWGVLTTTPLPAGSAFASNWEDLQWDGFSYILVTVFADTDCDVYVEQSPDQSNITHVTHLAYTANDNENNVIKAQIVDRYVRIRVVNNSGTDQTKLIVVRRYSMA